MQPHPIHGLLLYGIIAAFGGQLAKRDKSIPNWIPMAILAALGIAMYGGNYGWPALSFASVSDWLETAIIWAAALPGASSIFGLIPGMKTDSVTTIKTTAAPTLPPAPPAS